MAVNATEPLTRKEQLFVQRLLASHVMDDDTAIKVFESGGAGAGDDDDDDNENNAGPADLEESLPVINQQLSKGFGLEIATVIINKIKYHSIINTHADDISKLSEHYNPHERGLIRLIFQTLVDNAGGGGTSGGNNEDDDEEEDDDGNDNTKNTPGTASRSTLINLRGKLEGPLKLTLAGAEHVVETLLEENWIRITSNVEKNRRESHQAELELAPRTYLELSHLLVDMGLPQDSLPQFLFHRM